MTIIRAHEFHKIRISKRTALIATAIVSAVLIVMVCLLLAAHLEKVSRMKQLDETARQIFVTAQNDLTRAQASGALDAYAGSDARYSRGARIIRRSGGLSSYYCVSYVPGGKSDLENTILRDLLPQGTISEKVRTGGHYLIEYDFDNARILSVFYTDSSLGLNEATLKAGIRSSDRDGARMRRSYRTEENGKEHVIGYCAEGTSALAAAELVKPELTIRNGEKLTVTVTDPNFFKKAGSGAAARQLATNICINVVGESSGNMETVDLTVDGSGRKADDGGTDFWKVKSVSSGGTKSLRYTVTLDDITARGCHFAELFRELIPGENIEVFATVSTTNAAARPQVSNSGSTSSLFGRVDQDAGGSGVTAEVYGIRHLENLDSRISGISSEAGAGSVITAVLQSRDISWKKFAAAHSGSPLFIYDCSRNSSRGPEVMAENSFCSISSQTLKSYDGDGKTISGLVVRNNGLHGSRTGGMTNGGLFGTINASMTLSNMVLEDFDIMAPVAAGALAGEISDTEGGERGSAGSIFNVLVKNGRVRAVISRGGSAGGLVGNCKVYNNEFSVVGCGSTAVVTSCNGNSGGLIGKIDGTARIMDSYAGGHTEKGRYSRDVLNIVSLPAQLAAADKDAGSGGLVGRVTGRSAAVDFSGCNSTCSVQGLNAGGFVGSDTGGSGGHSYNSCYAAGLVLGKERGAFAGRIRSVTLSACSYLKGINGSLASAASRKNCHGGAAAADYYDAEKLAADNSSLARETHASDSAISGDRYPFVMVNNAGAENSESTFVHYGDWEKPAGSGGGIGGNAMFAYREGSSGAQHWKVVNATVNGSGRVSVTAVYSDLEDAAEEGSFVSDSETSYGRLCSERLSLPSFYEKAEKVRVGGRKLYYYKVNKSQLSHDVVVTPATKVGNREVRYKFNRAFAAAMDSASAWNIGTEDEPYQVRTAGQFENVDRYRNKCFWQSCDIRLHKTYGGPVIRGSFSGTYNASRSGDKTGFSISGFRQKIAGGNTAGLFEEVSGSGSIIGLRLQGHVTVRVGDTEKNTDLGGMAAVDLGSIRRSRADVDMEVKAGSVSGVVSAGLMAGRSGRGGSFEDSVSKGKLKLRGKGSGYVRAGGFVGAAGSRFMDRDVFVLYRCRADADLDIAYDDSGADNTNTLCVIGGLAGYLKGGSVSLCGAKYSLRSSSTHNYAGGFAGYVGSYDKTAAPGAAIDRCWSRGYISSAAESGWTCGFIAHTSADKTRKVILRDCYSATRFADGIRGTSILFTGGEPGIEEIENCFAVELSGDGDSPDIAASDRTFCGGVRLSRAANCYTCAGPTLEQPGVEYISSGKFRELSSFSDWDTRTWEVVNGRYPTLIEAPEN
jgi:hypothetical protein